MKNNLKRVLGYSFAIAFAWVASFGNANAILVKGHIDPEFQTSGTIDGLYWTADIAFDVGSDCLAPNSTNQLCNSVSAYSIDGTLTYSGQTTDIIFSQVAPPISLDVDSGGTVVGIGTPEIGPGAWGFTFPVLGSGFAWIKFDLPTDLEDPISTAQLFLQFCNTLGVAGDFSTLSERDCDPISQVCEPKRSAALASDVTNVEITQVPEPGVLWLTLIALSTGWIVRRRSA